ncbi:MAG TPA: hypothetical protein VF333_04425 [Pyrinomonadaceae bacterium]
MNGLQTLIRSDRPAKPRAYAVVVLACLALLALLTVVQVAHVHSVATDADHCPLCMVLHTAAPVAAAAAVIVLVQIDAAAPVVEICAVTRLFDAQLFTRPPPSASRAFFRLLVLA